MRGILLLCLALIGGPVLIFTGISDYRNSKKLMAEGKATTANVLKWEETRGRRGRHYYYLTVQFKPEQGADVNKRVSVGSDVYANAVAAQTVSAHYLPSDPRIFQLGETVQIQTSSIIVGSVMLLGALGYLGYKVSRSKNESTETISTTTSGQNEFKKAA